MARDHRTFEFRRSERVPVRMPIEVSGIHKRVLFRETANTLNISAHGALISVDTPLVEGQDVSLTNPKTLKAITGEVISVRRIVAGKRQVAIRFPQPSPHFWGISSPAEDWNSTERKLPMKR